MSPRNYPPLKLSEVVKILENNGFAHENTVGSHAKYVGIINGKRESVTVDLSIKEFSVTIIKYMIRQSGLTREKFYGSTKKTVTKI